MDDVVEEVKYKVEVPLKEPERFEDVGMSAPKACCSTAHRGLAKRIWRKSSRTKSKMRHFTASEAQSCLMS